MEVKLIGITNPTIEGIKTAEEFIAFTARVSNPSNQMNTLSAPKLLKYLVDNQHWSPFEMVSVVLDIQTTRDISHQIIRHRSFSFQEFSQRYADPTNMGIEISEARVQDVKNRQNSIITEDKKLNEWWLEQQNNIAIEAKKVYADAIYNGIAKELARKILPEGLTATRLYMSGTLRSWIHYINLRKANGTQKEHRDVALAALPIFLNIFPSLKDVFQE